MWIPPKILWLALIYSIMANYPEMKEGIALIWSDLGFGND